MKRLNVKLSVLALVMGLLVATSGCEMLNELVNPPDASPLPPAKPFEGTWENENSEDPAISQLEISQDGNKISVEAWGACTPTDCEWGTEEGFIDEGTAELTWDQDFVIRKLTLTLLGTHRMRVVTESVYTDGRPRNTWEEFFYKASE